MWLARNKKTGLPAGQFDDNAKAVMEAAPEYAGLVWERMESPAPAPRPEIIKPIELAEDKPKARRTRKTSDTTKGATDAQNLR